MRISQYLFIFLSAILICSCTTGQKHNAVEPYVKDATITTDVKAAIFKQTDLHLEEIDIETQNGIVQISGFAQRPDQIEKANEVITHVEGVKGITNDLTIKKDLFQQKTAD